MHKKEVLHHIISFDKSKIFYRLIRKAKKKAFIVLMHGLGSNHSFFKVEEKYFIKKRYNVLNIDLRGHGFSENKKGHIELKDFAKDVKQIFDKEKIKDAVLVGHSMGGFIAIKFCGMYPKYVKKIILIDSSYALNLKTLEPLIIFPGYPICLIINIFTWLFYRGPIKDLDFSKYRHKTELYITHLGSVATSAHSMFAGLLAMAEENLEPVLKKINVPTFIIEHKRDHIFSKLSFMIMHRDMPNSTIKIENGQHASVLQMPWQIEKDILRFVKK